MPSRRWDRRRVSVGLTIGIVVIGLGWRLARLLAGYPIWYDEAFIAITCMTRDVSGLFRPLEYFQVAPIGFLLMERGMTVTFGASALSLRLIPFLTGAASLLLFARFARRVLDRTSALLAVAIFAVSYYPSRHGAEVKPYAMDLLLALMTIDLAWSNRQHRDSLRHWLMLTAVVAIGVWFSYPLVFVAAGVGLMMAVDAWKTRAFPQVWRLLAMGAVWALSWLTMYIVVAGPQAAATSFYPRSITWREAFPPWREPWKLPYWLLDIHTGNMLAYPYGGNHFGSVATTFLVLIGCYALRRRRRSGLMLLLLSPLLPTFLASLAQRYPYGTSARTMLFMAPSFCLLGGVGAASVIRRLYPGRHKLPATARVVVIMGLLGISVSIYNIAEPYREVGDVENRRVIRELAAASQPGDVWIGYDGIRSVEVTDDLMVQHWVGQSAEVRYHVLQQAPGPVRWMPDRIDDLPTSGRTWLIVDRSGFESFDEARLAEIRSDLDRRLGEPIVHHQQLNRVISVVAYEYPPARFQPEGSAQHSPSGRSQ